LFKDCKSCTYTTESPQNITKNNCEKVFDMENDLMMRQRNMMTNTMTNNAPPFLNSGIQPMSVGVFHQSPKNNFGVTPLDIQNPICSVSYQSQQGLAKLETISSVGQSFAITKQDPNLPKKPMTPYLMFLNEHREEFREKFPELKITEIAKKAAEIWRDMKEEDKQVYLDKAKKATEKYLEEMKTYNERNNLDEEEDEEDEDESDNNSDDSYEED
ncbi:HMG (high mobility group) box domain containing protein, partial [Entamoeba invadens IP1]